MQDYLRIHASGEQFDWGRLLEGGLLFQTAMQAGFSGNLLVIRRANTSGGSS